MERSQETRFLIKILPRACECGDFKQNRRLDLVFSGAAEYLCTGKQRCIADYLNSKKGEFGF